MDRDRVGASLSAPIYIQFGEASMTRGKDVLRPYQAGLEPAVLALPSDTGGKWRLDLVPSLAVGIRRRWPGEWARFAVGVWGRVGLFDARLGVEPEIAVFVGRCCTPGSVEFSLRGSWSGDSLGFGFRVGFSYW